MKIGLGIGLNYKRNAGGAVAPVNTVAPVISGTAVVGQTLTAVAGTWTGIPTPSISGNWQRDGVNISGATSLTYTLVAADAGTNITYEETANNTAGTVTQDSNTLSVYNSMLDVYSGSTSAYSTRLLRGAELNNPIMRLRRSSDNTEVDVFVDTNYQLSLNSNINSRTSGTTLSSWVGANNAFLVTWHDQSTNTNNATQSTPANQPQVITNGVINTELSKPTVSFNATTFVQLTVNWTNTFAIHSLTKFNNTTTLQVPYRDNGPTNSTGIVGYITLNNTFYRVRQTGLGIGASISTEFGTTAKISTLSGDSTTGYAYINNTLRQSATVTGALGTIMYIGVNGVTPSQGLIGNQSEWIVFNSLTNLSNINTSMNNYYGAY